MESCSGDAGFALPREKSCKHVVCGGRIQSELRVVVELKASCSLIWHENRDEILIRYVLRRGLY